MTATGRSRLLPRLAALAAALALLAWAAAVGWERRCSPSTLESAPGCTPRTDGSPAHLQALRAEIGRNPGHAVAYARLASLDTGEGRSGALRAASSLWAGEPNMLRARAAWALEEGRLPDAVADLVRLTELYHSQLQEPARVLAQLIAAGQADLLSVHVQAGRSWLWPVLASLAEMKLPLASAGPLVAQASAVGALPSERLRELTRQLKDAGNWVDAYGLWIARHQGRVPVLYNGGFDHPLEPDGFDWEVNEGPLGRGGVQVDRRQSNPRGFVLEVRFTGRGIRAVPLRQLLYLSPGRYRLTGHYRAENLRTQSGLAWVVRCGSLASGREIGRSASLKGSESGWTVFEVSVVVPEGCGPVASLQLETEAAYEAAAGLRGKVFFDAFTLTGPDPS